MATLSGTLSLADVAKRLDPNGKPAMVAELLHQTNSILDDIPWKESNDLAGERITVRTSLPAPTWVSANEGIVPASSTTAQLMEGVGKLAAVSEVAQDVAEFGGNLQENLMLESRAHIESMGQEFVGTLVAGNSATSPNEFTGFYPRYNALTGTISQNVLSGSGASTDNSSILLVGWGIGKVYGIYPKGSQAGLKVTNRGLETIESTAGIGSAGARLLGYRTFFEWKCGLAVADWRYAVRIANIDISNLVAKSSAADLIELMIKAIHRIPNLDACKPVFYMNRSCFEMLHIQCRDDVQLGGQLKMDEVGGRIVRSFLGIPVKLVDQIGEAESAVS